MIAYVICINDGIKYIIINNEERAKEKMEELTTTHWEQNKWSFKDYENYRSRCYWHIHEVKCEIY